MIYIEIPTIDAMVKELQESKIREVRISSFIRNEQTSAGSGTSFFITLTALKGKDTILKTEGMIGRDLSVFEDRMKELALATEKQAKDLTKLLQSKKLIVKQGIYRFPKEL